MKGLILAAVTIVFASMASAEQPIANSAVEARLDALEKINVTAQKPAQVVSDVESADVEAILQKAAEAERSNDATE